MTKEEILPKDLIQKHFNDFSNYVENLKGDEYDLVIQLHNIYKKLLINKLTDEKQDEIQRVD